MINLQQDLLNKGYRKHVSKHHLTFKMTDTLYQKRITDDKGTKYFVDAWYYPAIQYSSVFVDESVQIECQFSGKREGETFANVILFEKDIDQAEKTLENMWDKLELGYYELEKR